MQEFLALNTDARIAFVKKPFIVSRIDKVQLKAFYLQFLQLHRMVIYALSHKHKFSSTEYQHEWEMAQL